MEEQKEMPTTPDHDRDTVVNAPAIDEASSGRNAGLSEGIATNPKDTFCSEYPEERAGAILIREEQHTITLNVPPPVIIEQYSRLYPDAPATFFRWAEEEMDHRRALDKKLVNGRVLDGHLGLILGFAAVLLVCSVAALAVIYGHPFTAGAISCVSLATLASVFIVGRATTKSQKIPLPPSEEQQNDASDSEHGSHR